jgi:hypothetical protein
MHCRYLQSLSLLRGIFRVILPPICWDLRILDSSESCLYHLGLLCAAFCDTTHSLSTLAISGLPSLSWTLMQAWLYSIVELTFGWLTIAASATVLCIRTYRWSQGHIPFRVSSSGVPCWVSVRPSLMRYGWYRRIFVPPQHSAELFWLRVQIR